MFSGRKLDNSLASWQNKSGSSDGLYENWDDLFGNLGETLSNAFNETTEYLGKMFDSAKEILGNAATWIGDKWTGMIDSVKGFVTGVGESITKGLSWIGETVGNAFGAAKQYISDFADKNMPHKFVKVWTGR